MIFYLQTGLGGPEDDVDYNGTHTIWEAEKRWRTSDARLYTYVSPHQSRINNINIYITSNLSSGAAGRDVDEANNGRLRNVHVNTNMPISKYIPNRCLFFFWDIQAIILPFLVI